MKPMLILFAGCLPLAVLTVWSFVELGSIDEQIGASGTSENVEVDTDLAAKAAGQVEREKPLVDELADVDLLSGDALDGLERVAEGSGFAPLEDTWPKWAGARQMVAEFLRIERLAAVAAPDRIDEIPLEGLPSTGGRLAELKRSLEEAKREYEKLKQEHQDSQARGAAPLFALLDRRIDELDRQVDRCKKRLEAAARLADARAAFQEREYDECARLCDQLLADHASVLEPSVAAKVGLLERRAQFWGDTEQLNAQLNDVEDLVRRKVLFEGFLSKYNDESSQTAAERQVIAQCEEQLRDVKERLAAAAADRAAEVMIRKLDQNLPSGFPDRLGSSVRILEAYRTEKVRTTLQGSVREWLREFLPEKRIAESPKLEEAETTDREIVRGYFAKVLAPNGVLDGYKRYPSPEALSDPAFDVGTYPKDAFVVPPGPSVPRRSVIRYHEARDRLIQEPGRRAVWLEMATLCESTEAELREYRDKSGASRDDPDLSFDAEARFLREFLAGAGWADIDQLFTP